MKTKNIFLTLALALSTTFAFAQSDISSTPHNMAGASWNTGQTEICITCHTPHNAFGTEGAPLWNHASTTTVFGLYTSTTSATLNASTGQPAGTSKLCLSCHDGTVDLIAYGDTADSGAETAGMVMDNANGKLLGTDLSTHHPVSFTYDNALFLADPGLYDPAATTAVSDLLYANKVECASCHDAHDGTNTNFLVMSNAASALCLTCHNK